ncbi:HNH endonuclease signature motif containing protein [Agromyces sp. SYSU T00194]|uniref:HNH endonuclease signature motif containing protein n=1 Tax=Agromyces chitinivorans TaxID=3158560 RepID=UPI003395B61F
MSGTPVLPDRIATKIDARDGHWLWTGWKNDAGYPYVHWLGRDRPAYRVVYEILVGPIEPGLELDHLCTTPACVRPDHLEPVTHAENQHRIAERQTACRRVGHDWTDPRNVRVRSNGRRYCAECDRINLRERYARKKGSVG